MRHLHWLFLATVASVTAPAALAQSQAPPSLPLRLEAALDAQTPRNANGRRYRDQSVRLEGGQRYRISVSSANFDPMVQVLAPGSEQVLVEDDDSGGLLNPRAVFTPVDSGDYVVRTLGFLPESAGGYQLQVELAPPLPPPLPTQPPGERTPDLTRWTSYTGSLTESDAGIGGVRFDDYLVTLGPDEDLFIQLDSDAFDPIVQVLPAGDREGMVLAGDDDSGPGVNAHLWFAPGTEGDYIVRVTSFGGNGTGEYRLRLGR